MYWFYLHPDKQHRGLVHDLASFIGMGNELNPRDENLVQDCG